MTEVADVRWVTPAEPLDLPVPDELLDLADADLQRK